MHSSKVESVLSASICNKTAMKFVGAYTQGIRKKFLEIEQEILDLASNIRGLFIHWFG